MKHFYEQVMSTDSELAFMLGSKLNIDKTEWEKLVARQKAIQSAFRHGIGDFVPLYQECVTANTTYLQLVNFDSSDPNESRIVKYLKRSIVAGLDVIKSLEYSLHAG